MNQAVKWLVTFGMLALMASCVSSNQQPRNVVPVEVDFDAVGCPIAPAPVNCRAGLDRVGFVCTEPGDNDIVWKKAAGAPANKDFTIEFDEKINKKSYVCRTSSDDKKKCKVKSSYQFGNAYALMFKYNIVGDQGCTVVDPYIIVMK